MGDLPVALLDSLRANNRQPPAPRPCLAWLPLAGGTLDKFAGVPVRHECALPMGHDGPHVCEDCDETWTAADDGAGWA